jgi:hypothetical protein
MRRALSSLIVLFLIAGCSSNGLQGSSGTDGGACPQTPAHCALGYTFDEATCGCVPIADGGLGARCSSANQCSIEQECAPGGIVSGCGSCTVPSPSCKLNSDSDCSDAGSGMICQSVTCSCNPTLGACVPGCTGNSDCGSGQTCNAGHCITPPCSTDASCGTNFVCDPTNHGCAPKSCGADADCSGYCVDGICSAQPGACEPEPE